MEVEQDVVVKAPEGVVCATVPVGGESVTVEVVAGEVHVSRDVALALQREGWQVPPELMPDADLDRQRKRHNHLRERLEDLHRQVETITGKEGTLLAAISEAQDKLAAGTGTVSDITKLLSQAEQARQARGTLEAAVGVVQRDADEVAGIIRTEETVREQRRQTAASDVIREEADRRLEEFILGLVNLTVPLQRHRELAEEVSKEYPLAPALDAVPLQALARRLAEASPEYGTLHPAVVTGWLTEVLRGPRTHAGALAEQMEANHLKD